MAETLTIFEQRDELQEVLRIGAQVVRFLRSSEPRVADLLLADLRGIESFVGSFLERFSLDQELTRPADLPSSPDLVYLSAFYFNRNPTVYRWVLEALRRVLGSDRSDPV